MIMTQMNCTDCNFFLYDCIAKLDVSTLAFVDDRRYPGRCMLGFNSHAELIDDLADEIYEKLMLDLKKAVRAIRLATKCDRVNVCLLCNREHHVHFHLTPRSGEFTQNTSPTHFQDARESLPLENSEREKIIMSIQNNLAN